MRERPLTTLWKVIPLRARTRLRPLLRRRARWGNLRRTSPFSDRYGFDRGTPIDRWYIERFLEQHADDVRGSVAEIKDSTYTNRFGGAGVTERHVIDVDASNPGATIVADLAAPDSLPTAAFDCAIVAQTLQYVSDPAAALANLYRSLKPGGRLLVTVPAIARVDPDVRDRDLFRFTPAGLADLASACKGATVDVGGRGNLVSAVAFLHGLAAGELRGAELAHDDPSFVVVSCARVVAPT